MADVSISTDRRSLQDRRFLEDRRIFKKDSLFVENIEFEQISQGTPFAAVFDFLCLIAVAVFSLVVYIATGFYNDVTSHVGHAILGGGLFIYFLIMFRRGLGLGILGFRFFGKKNR